MSDTSGSPAGPRILVVDDEPAVLDAYRRVLDLPTSGTSTAALDELRTRLFLSGGNAALLSRAPIRSPGKIFFIIEIPPCKVTCSNSC